MERRPVDPGTVATPSEVPEPNRRVCVTAVSSQVTRGCPPHPHSSPSEERQELLALVILSVFFVVVGLRLGRRVGDHLPRGERGLRVVGQIRLADTRLDEHAVSGLEVAKRLLPLTTHLRALTDADRERLR